mgnify:CR=1 FL=1
MSNGPCVLSMVLTTVSDLNVAILLHPTNARVLPDLVKTTKREITAHINFAL